MPRHHTTVRLHLAARLVGALAILGLVAGCGVGPFGGAEPGERRPSKVERARAVLDEVAAMPAVDVSDVARPVAPEGYDDRDVDQLVRDATDILERSVDPGLGAMTPDQAVDWVLAKQYDETREGLREAGRALGVGWQWMVTSRLPRAGRISFVDVRAEASTIAADDDPSARYLHVEVEAFAVHRFDGPGRPRVVVVRRAVGISSWDPFAGPDSPPWLTAGARAYGADFCSLPTAAVVEPTRSRRDLVAGARALRAAMRVEGVSQPDASGRSQQRYVEESRACAAT